MSNLKTSDLSDKFFVELRRIAEKLGASALDMAAVMMSESGVSAKAHNPNGGASGLIQFMPKTLLGLGWTKGPEAFRKLNAIDQLPFVEAYYLSYVGYLDSVAGLYVATFLPALIKHASKKNYVLTAKGGQLGWAYGPNAVFDSNKDLQITVQELEDAVARSCKGQRWAEISARISGDGLDVDTADDKPDLNTVEGLQQALSSLNIDPGPIDGIIGPKTVSAIKSFQQFVGLDPDGVYGPLTRAEIEKELK